MKWKKLSPKSEFYLFIRHNDKRYANKYQSYYKVTDIFPVNNVGIVTARDSFVIDYDKKQLEKRIRQFIDSNYEEGILKQTYGLKENKSWKIKEQREKLRKDDKWQSVFTQILYRPFDVQWIFYHDEMVERSRKEVMRHMLQENIGIVTSRQTSSDFRHVFITDKIIEFNLTGTAGKYGSGYPGSLPREQNHPAYQGVHDQLADRRCTSPIRAERLLLNWERKSNGCGLACRNRPKSPRLLCRTTPP